MIKAQYLGAEKKKKKVLKGAEKFKFNFDWEAGDDTSRDLNPLYNSTHGEQRSKHVRMTWFFRLQVAYLQSTVHL